MELNDRIEEQARAMGADFFGVADLSADEPREARFEAHRCRQYFAEMGKTMEPAVCGLCVYVCPYGRRQGNGAGAGKSP